MPFVYSERYYADFGEHVFPVEKYKLIHAALLQRGVAENEFYEPQEAPRDDLLLVHTPAFLEDLDTCKMTYRTMFSELPLNPTIIHLFKLAAGGTELAVTLAQEARWAVHIGGGFHHAFEARAEGFCYINDLAVAARKFLQVHRGGKVLIIDLDLHQGNGTARIFYSEKSVFTFSMHQADIYPPKEKSDLDIDLPAGTGDSDYLQLLNDAMQKIDKRFPADLILYQAGADPYSGDQLGDLRLTKSGLHERDRVVIEYAARRRVPLVITLGGGYARKTRDTVDIHVGTCIAVREHFEKL